MICISGGRVLSDDGQIRHANVLIRDGRIHDVVSDTVADHSAARQIRANGALVLPGIIDLHGDAFERQVMPRPGVHIPLPVALLETDRQMLSNGITTAYHGLTWSWEPGLRGRAAALEFIRTLDSLRADLGCDTRLHLRHEIANLDDEAAIAEQIEDGQVDLLAFNDHLDGIARDLKGSPRKASVFAARTGLPVAELMERVERLQARRDEWGPSRARLAEIAAGKGVPMASHDDDTPTFRREMQGLGCTLSEFPVDAATARAARELGNPVILGAPNILRGGSHCGRLNAADAVGDGLGTVLTSDYFYPALLLSAFRLARDGVCALADAWGLLSWNPADAVGLTDRGRIARGLRADLVLVDDRLPDCPRVQATFVNGKCRHFAMGMEAIAPAPAVQNALTL